jgi:2-polyprenyl-3-methyl-5-hydroxy-6-metoxy-1,4-benzoquinol methylase
MSPVSEATNSQHAARWPTDGLEHVGECPVCRSPVRTLLHDHLKDRVFYCAPGEWTLWSCGRCGVAYLDPRPTPDTIGLAYSTYVTHHAVRRVSTDNLTGLRRWRRALANGYRYWRYGVNESPRTWLGVPLAFLLFAERAGLDADHRHLPKPVAGARLLDVGSGAGAFLQWATAAGWDAVGIDPDPKAVQTVKERGLQAYEGTVETIRGHVSAFDAVTLSHVLEHVHDPRALLSGIRDLLKPGGLLWLDTPNIAALGERRFGSSWLGLDPPRHLVLFNQPTLLTLLESVGFAVLRQPSRFEICKMTYAVSERIAGGSEDPLRPAPASFGVRLQAHAAALRALADKRRSEFITVIAARQ